MKGIAASLVDGKTTHHIGCISVNGRELNEKSKKKLALIWKDVQYLILDECSMLSQEFFAKLSRHVAIAKMEYNPLVTDLAFGGINVVLCGDFH